MEKSIKHKVFNLIILDESGSMQTIKKATISGFNEIVQTIKGVQDLYPEQDHFITLVTFNGWGIRTLLTNAHVGELKEINEKWFKPSSSTPLFDAMGKSISDLRKEIGTYPYYNVLVTIFTDGEENASRVYDGRTIKKLVEELSFGNWTFTYIGANHDVAGFADRISILNSMSYKTNVEDMKRMFDLEKNARLKYSQNIREKKDFKKKFYDLDGEPTD